MEQHSAPIPCNSLVVFPGQPARRASQTMQARLSIPSLAEKFNSCIIFKPCLLPYRRYHSGRWLLFLPSLRTEIVAAVRGGPSLLPSPPSEEAGCRAELRHPGRRIPGDCPGTLPRCQRRPSLLPALSPFRPAPESVAAHTRSGAGSRSWLGAARLREAPLPARLSRPGLRGQTRVPPAPHRCSG